MASDEVIIMNDDIHHHDFDTLSFCDLPIQNSNDQIDLQSNLATCPQTKHTSDHDEDDEEHLVFEFPTSPDQTTHNRTDSIVFFGKTIIPRKPNVNYETGTGRNRHVYVSPQMSPCPSPNRSSLFRFGLGKPFSSPATGSYDRRPSEVRPTKRRHGKRSEGRVIPATGRGGEGRSGGAHWGMLNPLRCGAYFMNALTKATFGLIPHV